MHIIYFDTYYDNITKTRLFKYIENFTSKNWKFSDKRNYYIFQIYAQNIDCGYSLEPPRQGGSNQYPQSMFLNRNKKNNLYPCKSQFYYMKVGFKGMITQYIHFSCVHNTLVLTVKLQRLHRWLVYLRVSWFELVFESIRKCYNSSRKQIFRDILVVFFPEYG